MNKTLKLPKELAEKVKAWLMEKGFWEISLPNALYSLTDGETNIAFYPSGTMLLQGKRSKEIKDQILSLIEPLGKISIGCDESGKGDVFGPLVVCCALIKPDYYKKVLGLNYRDCKKMKDEEVLRKAKSFMDFGEFKCKILEPLELNLLYEKVGNLNRILDHLYGSLIKELREKYPKEEILIDAYSPKNPFGGNVIFQHKGEENLAVAVASVLARAEFLKWINSKGLPKGSSQESLLLAQRIFAEDRERAKSLLKTFFL